MDVLVVDDEPLVRDLVADDLMHDGLDVAEAPTAEVALDVISSAGPPEVVVADVILGPGMDGLTLVEEMRRRWPRVAVIVMTGKPIQPRVRTFGNREIVLEKPFGPARLVAAVRELMKRSAR